jgi:hypothetical protein
MRSSERLIIYGALIVLGVITLSAATGGRAAASHPVWLEDLGPVDAVTFTGEPPLAVRNAGGRAAWGGHASARAYSTAFVHLGKPLSRLLEAERYTEQRERLVEELRTRFDELRGRFDDLQRRFGDLKPDDPQAPEAQLAFNELIQARQQLEAESIRRQEKLRSEQIEEAYRQIIDAVEVVARRREIDIVYRFVPTALPFEAENTQQAQMTIQARTVLRYPEALDITPDVMLEMALENE